MELSVGGEGRQIGSSVYGIILFDLVSWDLGDGKGMLVVVKEK